MNGKRAKALRRLAERKDTVNEMKQRSAQISPSTIENRPGWILALNEVSTNVQGQPPTTRVLLFDEYEEASNELRAYLVGNKPQIVPVPG